MLTRLIASGLAFLTLATAASAATYTFTVENDTGIRIYDVGVTTKGEISGFEALKSGTEEFQITIPDGECIVGLRFRFSPQPGMPRHVHDTAHNLCAGDTSVRLFLQHR